MSRPSIADESMPDEFTWAGFFSEFQNDLVPLTRWRVLVRSAHPKQLGHRARLILLVLATYTRSDTCHVGVERLARECAMSDRTVRDVLKLLEAGGWIQRERVSRRAATVTTLCWPNSWWFTDPESGSYGYRTESGKEAAALAEPESGSSLSESGNSGSESGKTEPESGSQAAAECSEDVGDDAHVMRPGCPSGCDRGFIIYEDGSTDICPQCDGGRSRAA